MDEQEILEMLERGMASAADAEGNDVYLSKRLASMSEDERQRSEENLRKSIEEARASIKGK